MMPRWTIPKNLLCLKNTISLWATIATTVWTAVPTLGLSHVIMYWGRRGLYGIHTTIIRQCLQCGIGTVKCAGTDLVWG